MKKIVLSFFGILMVFSLSGCHRECRKITSKAIWKPSQVTVQKIFQCREHPKSYIKCLVQVMRRNHATDEAISFTKRIDGRGFMNGYLPLAHGVGLVSTFELGADYSQGCYFVNGRPNIINILSSKKIPRNLWLKQCKIVKIQENSGSVTYFLNYMQKICHACSWQGEKNLGFQFDFKGRFLGIRQ